MPTRKQHEAAKARGRAVYDELLALQGGVCPGCHRPPGKRRHCVDHDWRTLEVRGLLCFRCNYVLSPRWGTTPEVLRRLADYLEQPPARELPELQEPAP